MSDLAVIVIDMLNPYDHEDAEHLAAHVEEMVEPTQRLIAMTQETEGVDLVYVNDNYGNYHASRHDMVEAALAGERPDLVEPIVPPEGSEFLQKVRHSAFYSTALDHLLRERDIRKVLLAGQVTEQCILYSALDAYVRHFEILVARDAVAAIDDELGDAALEMMQRNMRVQLTDVANCMAS